MEIIKAQKGLVLLLGVFLATIFFESGINENALTKQVINKKPLSMTGV